MPVEASYALIAAAVAAVVGLVCFLLGIRYRKTVAEKEISSAEEEARRIINEAIKSSENKKREALLEAKEEILKNVNLHYSLFSLYLIFIFYLLS